MSKKLTVYLAGKINRQKHEIVKDCSNSIIFISDGSEYFFSNREFEFMDYNKYLTYDSSTKLILECDLLITYIDTSQKCSACEDIHRSNRVGEIFKCKNCGYTSDADYNASLNILSRFRSQEYMVSV